MLAALSKIKTVLFKALETVVILLMAVLTLDVMWQIFTRMASGIPQSIVAIKPSRWTDELAVMLMIWVALFGASVAFNKKGHLGVDYFVGKLPQKAKVFSELIVYLLTAIFAATCMIYGGIIFVAENTRQFSPALDIPMGVVYVAVPVSGFFFLMISFEAIFERVTALRNPEKSAGENRA